MLHEHTDALGNSLQIGAVYGYSTSSSGFSRVVVGSLKSVAAKKVTLVPITVKRFIYGQPYENEYLTDGATVSVSPHHLFPVAS